jgi:hypothetical protein
MGHHPLRLAWRSIDGDDACQGLKNHRRSKPPVISSPSNAGDQLHFRKIQSQHPVGQLGIDLVLVDHLGERELPVEAPGFILDDHVFLVRTFSRFDVADDGQDIVAQVDVQLVRLDAGNVGQKGDGLLGFEDIHLGRESRPGDGLFGRCGQLLLLFHLDFLAVCHRAHLLSCLSYADLPRLGRLRLRNDHGQNSVHHTGLDLVRVDFARKPHDPGKLSGLPFAAMVSGFLVFGGDFAFAADRDAVGCRLHVEVAGGHAGQLGANEKAVLVLGQVDQGKHPRGLALCGPALQLTFHLTPDSLEFGEGGPAFPGWKTVKPSVDHIRTSFLDLFTSLPS